MRDFPRFVEFELTNVCPLECIMCPHKIMVRKQGFMDIDLFKSGVDECQDRVERSYLHQIGEPLLHPDLIECINYASRAGIKTSLSTSCVSLNELMTEKILDSKLDEIILSIDSLMPEVYKKIRKQSDLWTVLDNVDYFIARKIEKGSKIFIRALLIEMQENKSEVEAFKRRFSIPGVDHVWIKDYSTFAGKVKKGESPPSRREGCPKPSLHTTIQWNGDMVACCRDYEGVSAMGNIKDQSIKDIWNSDKYNEFRKTFESSGLCKEC